MIRALLLARLAAAALAGVTQAASPVHVLSSADEARGAPVVRVDWQDPAALPPQFRNHCTVAPWSGRPYCEDHCGRGYEIFYCTPVSFGCCRVGHGYCDLHGHLRCSP